VSDTSRDTSCDTSRDPVRTLSAWTRPTGTTDIATPSWCGRPGRTSSSPHSSPDLAPGPAIDLAAGEGRNAIWLAEQGWDATAVDFSEVAIGKAREIAERRGVAITTEVADLTTYEPAPSRLRPRRDRLPADPRRAARPDPAASRGRRGAGRHLPARQPRPRQPRRRVRRPAAPAVLTTPEQVVAAIGDAVVVERAEVAERHVQTDDGERVALDTLVLARRPG
jgi:hypothetical protein